MQAIYINLLDKLYFNQLSIKLYSAQRKDFLAHQVEKSNVLPWVIVFPGINYNTIIDLMPDYFCRILIQGSDTLSLETNQNIFRRVFKFIDESGRFNHNDENDAHD